MKKELETRFYDVKLEAREEGEEGVVDGRPIVFNRMADIGGMFAEVIEQGALDGADLNDVRLCLNHDTSYVYARSRRNNPNSTMQLMPDVEGMAIRANLAIKSSPKAMDYFSAVKRGDMDKMSFMFSVEEDRWVGLDTNYPTRYITKIGKVVEVSCVTFPAYDSTSINARSKEALDSARSALDSEKAKRAKASLDSDRELALLKAKLDIF